uniref:Uncharacterized protein n=1 Tax=Anopheles dirus TaxID=7168 RepID=A0A182N3M2_9DIPT
MIERRSGNHTQNATEIVTSGNAHLKEDGAACRTSRHGTWLVRTVGYSPCLPSWQHRRNLGPDRRPKPALQDLGQCQCQTVAAHTVGAYEPDERCPEHLDCFGFRTTTTTRSEPPPSSPPPRPQTRVLDRLGDATY